MSYPIARPRRRSSLSVSSTPERPDSHSHDHTHIAPSPSPKPAAASFPASPSGSGPGSGLGKMSEKGREGMRELGKSVSPFFGAVGFGGKSSPSTPGSGSSCGKRSLPGRKRDALSGYLEVSEEKEKRDKDAVAGGAEVDMNKVWGMPEWMEVVGEEVEPGIKVLSADQLKVLMTHYNRLETPTSVLFPWLHGIGDGPDGANGPLEQFFGNPSLDPPRYRGLCILRAPTPPVPEHKSPKRYTESPPKLQEDPTTAPDPLSSSKEEASSIPISSTPESFSASSSMYISQDSSAFQTHDRRNTMSSQLSSSPSTVYSTEPSLYSLTHTGRLSSTSTETAPDESFRSGSWTSCEGEGLDLGHKWENLALSPAVGGCATLPEVDRSEEGEDVIPQGMHPTAVKAPSTKLSRKGTNTSTWSMAAALTKENMVSEVDPMVGTEEEAEHGEGEGGRTPSCSPQVQRGRAVHVADVEKQTSMDSMIKSGNQPEIKRSISTPETPVSAHPADQLSGLRTISGRGRSRTPALGDRHERSLPASAPKTPDMQPSVVHEEPDCNGIEMLDTSDVENEEPAEDVDMAEEAEPLPSRPPNSMLLNAIRTEEVLDLTMGVSDFAPCKFVKPDLNGEISLRNLRIQEIKYASISDLVIYAPSSEVPADREYLLSVARKARQAIDNMYEERLQQFHQETAGHIPGNGSSDFGRYSSIGPGDLHHAGRAHPQEDRSAIPKDEPDEREDSDPFFADVLVQARQRDLWQQEHGGQHPIRYNVCVVTEPFAVLQRQLPELVEVTKDGKVRPERDLWVREMEESTKLAGATQLVEGLWLGNGRDDPFRPDRTSPWLNVDLAIEAHDLADMPSDGILEAVQIALVAMKAKQQGGKAKSDVIKDLTGPLYLEVGSSSRSSACAGHPFDVLAQRLVNLVDVVEKLLKQKKKDSKHAMNILLFCEDGYTETSLFAITYLMYTKSLSLIDAYLALHLEHHRSFFIYPFDVPFLRVVEKHIVECRGKPRKSLNRPGSPMSRWNPFIFGRNQAGADAKEGKEKGDSSRRSGRKYMAFDSTPKKTWMDHPRFDGSLPSRIEDHMYLGSLAHAANSELLKALGITHVVSVGETLKDDTSLIHGHYIDASELSTSVRLPDSTKQGCIKVMEIENVKDDGRDSLQPKLEAACAFIEEARKGGGKTLVHCRVGVSRSATVVIAYLMEYGHKTLMDAYMMTRARRLNVLIQPSLLFLKESLYLESELCRHGKLNATMKQRWTWPAFCRDIWALNKRYLVPGG